MKYSLRRTKSFEKRLRKLVLKDKKLGQKFINVLDQLSKNPFHASLKTHKVNSKLWGKKWSSYVTGDIRIIWDFFEDKLTLILLDTEGHSGKRKIYN